jgi:hypothetical protein
VDGCGREPLRLADVSFASGTLAHDGDAPPQAAGTFRDQLAEARGLAAALEASPPRPVPDPPLPREFELARWFPLPSEALADLRALRIERRETR